MPFRDVRGWLEDIVDATEAINDFIGSSSYEQFVSSDLTRAAVGRKRMIASEAAIRLGDDAVRLIPDHDWAGLRAIGNVIRHAYDRIDDRFTWEAATAELPELRKCILSVLKSDIA